MNMITDLRYGLRMLLKHKGFTAVAALTLALGIGANTAIFSVVDAVLLRPLQYRDAERLVKLLGTNRNRASLALIREWKNQSRSFDEMAAILNNWSFRVTGQTAPEDIDGNLVSANIFSLLGVRAALGRTFLPDDERPDSEPVVILSHLYWATQFGSAPDVIGRTITIDGRAHVIVGVLAGDFRETFEHIPGRAQIWKPAASAPGAMSPPGRGPYIALARLKPGVSLEQASAEMKTIAERLSQTYPNSARNVGAAVYSLHEDLYLSLMQFPQPGMNLVARTAADPEGYFGAMRDIVFSLDKNQPVGHLTTMDRIWRDYTVRPRFYLSLIGSLAILAVLLAAAGIYGVLSHIVSQRVHEIGIRRALGARDADVLRLVIKQGMILALLGIAAGLGGALALARLMRGSLYEVGPNDPATFIAVAGLLFLVALCACYAPARRATKVDPLVALRYQ
jgi:ABC-type antimicrobial peptide transport system permease subunit